MTDNMIELGKRAVACKNWRWMPGMRCVRNDGLSYVVVCAVSATKVEPTWLPDVTDPATVGCLLALVREAWGDPTLCVVLDTSDGRWCVGCWEDNGIAMRGRGGATETEALVTALEGAP